MNDRAKPSVKWTGMDYDRTALTSTLPSHPDSRQEFHGLDSLAISGQRDEMSEISAYYSGCGVHLRRRECIHCDDRALGFRRSHKMVRFVVRPMALVTSGKNVMEDHLGPRPGLFKRQMRVWTVAVTGGHPKVIADQDSDGQAGDGEHKLRRAGGNGLGIPVG